MAKLVTISHSLYQVLILLLIRNILQDKNVSVKECQKFSETTENQNKHGGSKRSVKAGKEQMNENEHNFELLSCKSINNNGLLYIMCEEKKTLYCYIILFKVNSNFLRRKQIS